MTATAPPSSATATIAGGLQTTVPRFGLALSGGGFRAAAFHLGVLKRLEELGLLARVEMLSTVSGGSITGTLYALRCVESGTGRPGSYPVDALIEEMRPVLTDNLRGSALFGTPWRGLAALGSIVSRRISRVGLMARELDRRLFGGATLDRLPPWIVVNATNLRTGKAWKFFHDAAGDYLVGATRDTGHIRITEAVAASAAYPGLTDSYAFRTRWEDIRTELLDGRWGRPDGPSRWRERFGKPKGHVAFPLVDGGLYDNEGMNGLRGAKMTHAFLSGANPPESDDATGFGPRRYLRIVEVIHDRLGAATRQLTHEMTHGVHPKAAADAMGAVAQQLRIRAADPATEPPDAAAFQALAERVETLMTVGTPPRGHQFTASAQVLLHRRDLAKGGFPGFDVPQEFRGLAPALVAELSRVRTDLDALDPKVLDLLIAQGYFLADCFAKLTMPDLLTTDGGEGWYSDTWMPRWEPARAAVATANANAAATADLLRAAARRGGLVGRTPRRLRRWWLRSVGAAMVLSAISALLAVLFATDYAVHALLRALSS